MKTLKYQPPEMRALEITRMKQEVREAIANGKRIIYTDEAMFTTATMLDRSYAGRHQNVTLEDKLASSPALAVLAGVSQEKGLEAHLMQARSIDSEAFNQYLLSLISGSKPSDFAILADNCRVHHSKVVAKFARENGIQIIFMVAYGPEFNPIERFWSKVKLAFKKQRMQAILEGASPDFEKLLRRILLGYSTEKIASICQRTYESMLAI